MGAVGGAWAGAEYGALAGTAGGPVGVGIGVVVGGLAPRANRGNVRKADWRLVRLSENWTLYDRLERMAVSQSRVVDRRTLAGDIRIQMDDIGYRADPSGAQLGLIGLYLEQQVSERGFTDNIAVILTRFVVDATVEVNDLFDHAFAEARALPDWTEQRADRYPISTRTQGATLQAGSYRRDTGTWLYTVNKFEVYQRSNVVYLLQCTGTTISMDLAKWSTLIDTVTSARFDD